MHGPSPAPTNVCAAPGGQCTKSQAEVTFLVLDDQDAFAHRHEEVLL